MISEQALIDATRAALPEDIRKNIVMMTSP